MISSVNILPSTEETIGIRTAVFVPLPRTSTFGGIHSLQVNPGGTAIAKSS